MMEGELPRGWSWTSLAAIADLKGGITKGQRRASGERLQLVPYLRVANVQRGYLDLAEVKEIEASVAEISELRLIPGDVLFNEGGDRDKLGRGWIWNGELPLCIHQNHVFRARIRFGVIHPKLLSWYANTRGQQYFLEHGKQTTNLASINMTKLGALPVPVPPLREQTRILEEVEKYLSDIDAGVASLERVLANLKRYRAAVLKAACEGRLVPTEAELARKEGREYEPGDVLLRRILEERRARWEGDQLAKMKVKGQIHSDDRWKVKYEEPEGPDASDLPNLPEGWAWAKLGSVADVQLGQQRAPVHAAAEVTYPYVRAANITWRGLDLSDVKQMGFPDPERYRLAPGDVLLSEASGSPSEVGKPAIWRGEIPGCCYQKTLLRVRSYCPDLAPEWLHLGFMRDALLGRFAKMAPGVGILHLTAERMLEWPVVIAPIAEQRRILTEVARLQSIIDEMEQSVNVQLARAQRLRQSVLKRAFEGKLVPQDPHDEPASVLLERIRSSQNTTELKKPRRPSARRRSSDTEVDP
ncbi:hypothetical protein WMF39_45960 [Sorangium sp. So ce1504]|uniref:hypothetical protein n=1 Tax=Sorangium sp. So ce1504 TaxID=3133337 RepID=UPI003F6234F7